MKIILALVATALAVLLILSVTSGRKLKTDLATAQSEINRLNSPVEQTPPPASPAEVERLRADQRETIRLRGEVVRLKDAVQTAEKVAATAKASASPVKDQTAVESVLKIEPLPENNPDAFVLKTPQVTSELPSGSALVLGGWESQEGKRLFVIVQPNRQPDGSVAIVAKWVEGPAETFRRMGNPLAAPGEQNMQIERISFDRMLKSFKDVEGIDLLSPAIITTASGRQARLTVGETRDTAAGPVEFGPRIDVLPTLSEDGSNIRLSIQASIVQSPPKVQ